MAVESCVMMNCMILFPVQKSSGAVVIRPELAGYGAHMLREDTRVYTFCLENLCERFSVEEQDIDVRIVGYVSTLDLYFFV